MREEILSLVDDRTGDAVFPMQAFPRLARLLAPNALVRLDRCRSVLPAPLSTTRSGPGKQRRSQWGEEEEQGRRCQRSAARLTWMVFITPLARTAIFPATVFTPCLNWAMSGPEGRTLSKPETRPAGGSTALSPPLKVVPVSQLTAAGKISELLQLLDRLQLELVPEDQMDPAKNIQFQNQENCSFCRQPTKNEWHQQVLSKHTGS